LKTPRIYADTSVFGGCFDREFEQHSRLFFTDVANGRFRLVISSVTAEELQGAPEHVRAVLDSLPTDAMEYFEVSEDMVELRSGYIKARVLGASSENDALHVAAATVLNADMIVSWNFKHIVHYDKIAGFNAVNGLFGYKEIRIYSPREVVNG